MTQAANLGALGTNAGTTGILASTGGGTGTTAGVTGFKNRIINGAMVIDQRNAGASLSMTTSTYGLDRYRCFASQTSKMTVQRNAGSVTPPTGFTNYMGFTSSSAYSSLSTDRFMVIQGIEGYNIADLGWGTADAKTVTVSFWVRSSLTGTHSGALGNDAGSRSYVFSFTISSANTWEYKTVTIVGETSGTWLTDNQGGIYFYFNLGCGSNYLTTAGSWANGYYIGATGATSVVGTNGATFYITGVQLEVGSTATSFDYRPYGTELQLCQRYFEAGSVWREGTNAANGNFCVFTSSFLVQKRANATFTYGNVGGANAGVASIQGPEATYEWISPYDQTNVRTGFAFRFVTNNNTSTLRQYFTASAEL